jgi:hypothetical protein
MRPRTWLLLVSLGLAGCFHSTPVTPAPATEAEVAKIQADLRSRSWESRRWRPDDGDWRDDKLPTQFLFGESWVTMESANSAGVLCDQCPYSFVGRNMMVKGPYGPLMFRVDKDEPEHIELFWYDLSRSLDLRPLVLPSR